MFLNPQYLIFDMYLNHSGPRLLKTDVRCDSFPAPEYEKGRSQAVAHIPYLDVSATMSEDKKTLYLGVLNLNISKVIETEITIRGWRPKSNGRMIWLDGNHYMTENTFEKPDNITIKDKTLRNLNNPVIYNFPPHSVSILEYYRE
jgi:alpha-N-arabinofuranosidase